MLKAELSAPRVAKYADKVGAYLLASRINSTVVDPGGFFEFEQYVTGYGEIYSAKLQCYISGDIFEKGSSSYLRNGLALDDGKFTFGCVDYILKGEGFTCHLTGAIKEGWQENTLFIDSNSDGTCGIMTEMNLNNAPFTYHLKIKKNVKPGDYKIDVYLTYFNGEKWQCNKETVVFKVRSFFEKWSAALSILGVLVGVTAIIRFAISIFNYSF